MYQIIRRFNQYFRSLLLSFRKYKADAYFVYGMAFSGWTPSKTKQGQYTSTLRLYDDFSTVTIAKYLFSLFLQKDKALGLPTVKNLCIVIYVPKLDKEFTRNLGEFVFTHDPSLDVRDLASKIEMVLDEYKGSKPASIHLYSTESKHSRS